MKNFLLAFLFSFAFPVAVWATHIVGGSLTYEHLGGSTYRVTLKLYRDCGSGNAAFPANVRIEVRQPNGTSFTPDKDIIIPFPGATQLQPQIDTCAVNPGICVEEAIYSRVVNNLPPNTGGYHLFYQLCCRNASLSNIQNPLSTGESWYTYIPDNSTYLTNSSPSWVNFPPVFVCQAMPLNFDHSATDADGDSLTYSLYTPYSDPAPTFPGNAATFTPVAWQTGYGPTNPLGGPPGSLSINTNGILIGSPPFLGQFVVGIKCEEWRNGIKIGEILRDFQFNVVYCPPLAQAGIGPSDACSGSAVVFNNTSTGNASTTYLWNFGDGSTTADTSSQQNPTYTYPGIGSYTATLIINPGTGCADTAYQTINISWSNASFSSNTPVCVGSQVSFTDNSTVAPNSTLNSWSWDFGDGNQSTSQSPSHVYNFGGTYPVTLIVSSAFGCVDSITTNITIQGEPIANAGNDTTSCTNNPTVALGGTVLNATGGVWSGPGTFSPNTTTLNATYTPTAGEVSAGFAQLVLYTTGNGLCASDSDTVIITFTAGPTVAAGPDTIFVCKDTTYIPLSGTVTVATGGTWSTPNGTGSFNPGPGQLNTSYVPSAADTAAGTVTLVLTTTGNGNCNASRDTAIVIFTGTPVVTASAADTACAGDAIPLGVSTTTSQGVWSTSGTGTFSPDNITLNASYIPSAADAAAGNVTLVFSSTNNGGCRTQTDTLFINLIPSPAAGFTSVSACPGSPVQFTDASSTTVGNIVSWSWNYGDLSPAGSGQNTSHSYSAPGNFNVTLTVTSNNGCIDTITQIASVYFPPQADFIATNLCLDDGAIFTDTSTVNGGTVTGWQWYFGDGNQSTQQNPSHQYAAGGSYPVTLIATSNQGCSDTITQAITIFPSPIADFTASSYSVDLFENINFTDVSSNAVSWYWDFGDSTNSTQQNPTHNYSVGGIYQVMLVITDANGCTDTVYHEIIVSLQPEIPTGFTPNGDGQNDILYVLGGPFKKLEFRIYNNWGELIFVSSNQADGWDGTRDGIRQPVGVYVYTVVGVTEDDQEHKLSGDVTLLR
jgi:gliding motility-associated-like protein